MDDEGGYIQANEDSIIQKGKKDEDGIAIEPYRHKNNKKNCETGQLVKIMPKACHSL